MIGRELVHLVTTLLLDLILIANPLVMVAVSSYESSGAVNEGPGGEEQFVYTVRRRP